MAGRLKGLEHADPLAVPLPHGTEVTTRGDRLAGAHEVRRGAVGRVVAGRGDEYDVLVVGVGTLTYRRDELLPRRAGQMRFATRREAAWAQLSPCVVLETVVGSHAWGLADEASDVDRRGAFVVPFGWTTGLAAAPEELVSADASSTYWEAGKLVQQALRADPNTLEALFVEGARPLDEMGEWILAERDAFVSSAIYGSFARYALSQLKKLRQSTRLAEHRALVLAWLRADPPPSLDDIARRLAVAAHIEAPSVADAELLAKEYVKQLYRSMRDQGLLPGSDFASLVAYAREGGEAPDVARELRPKNAYNLLRLLATALSWLTTGTPAFRLDEPFRSRLLAIKKGHVSLAEVIEQAEGLTPALEAARHETRLPAKPDVVRADRLLRRLRQEAARRWFVEDGNAWARGSSAPPDAEWEGA